MDEDVDDMEAEVLTGRAVAMAGACTSTLSLAVAVTRVVVMRLGRGTLAAGAALAAAGHPSGQDVDACNKQNIR